MGKKPKAGKSAIPAWRRQLAAVMEQALCQNAQQQFAVAGHLQGLPFDIATSIQVTGLPGHLQLPITEQQLSSLSSLGEPAPFGLGTETVLDPAVRKATQIEAARVQTNGIWQQQMQQLTARVAKGLGVDEHARVEAHPYKLLIYTEGGHFKAHRDTEKEPGMFGTLVVQLPVIGGHKGGDFAFHHNDKTIKWSTEEHSSSQFQYAAFYADVEHELQPITSGTRVVLVYSLVRTGTSLTPKPVDASPLIQEMRAAVASWEQSQDFATEAQQRLYIPLEHRYTEASLSFDTLKGRDAKMMSCLTHPDVGLEVHVALMVKTKQYRENRDPSEYRPSDVNYTAQACISASGAMLCEMLHDRWLDPEASWLDSKLLQPQDWWGEQTQETGDYSKDKGEEADLSMIQDNDEGDESEMGHDEYDDVASEYGSGSEDSDAAAGREEDETRDVNYTGNECSTVEKIYRRAMVVIWPKAHTSSIIARDGFESAVYLLDMRAQSGSKTEIMSALDTMMSIYQKGMETRKSHQTANPSKYREYSTYDGWCQASTMAKALLACSKLEAAVAVPSMLTILLDLYAVGENEHDNWHWHLNEDRHHDKIRESLVDSMIAVGEPDALVTALVERVQPLAIQGTIACARLAVAAAQKSASLGAAIADAVLSQTLFASNAAKVLASLSDEHVCSLAVMLCEIPSHRKHLDAYAAVVVKLPARTEGYWSSETDKFVLRKLLKCLQFQAAAFHTPTAVVTVAGAYKQWWQQVLLLVPEFTWKMPEAKLPSYPEVEAFFHSDQMSATFSDCFKDGNSARTLLLDHLHCWGAQWGSSISEDASLDTFSAKVTASGLDGLPVVTITKTQRHHDGLVSKITTHNSHVRAKIRPADALLNVCSKVTSDAGVTLG